MPRQNDENRSSFFRILLLRPNPPPPLLCTLWCQLEDMFQLIGTPQGIERVLFQITVTPQCFEKYRVKYEALKIF